MGWGELELGSGFGGWRRACVILTFSASQPSSTCSKLSLNPKIPTSPSSNLLHIHPNRPTQLHHTSPFHSRAQLHLSHNPRSPTFSLTFPLMFPEPRYIQQLPHDKHLPHCPHPLSLHATQSPCNHSHLSFPKKQSSHFNIPPSIFLAKNGGFD